MKKYCFTDEPKIAIKFGTNSDAYLTQKWSQSVISKPALERLSREIEEFKSADHLNDCLKASGE